MFIVKVPSINAFGITKGCERAGEAIIKELRNIWTNEEGRIVDVDLLDLEEIHLDNSNLELTNNLIYKNSLEIFETKSKTIFLGGDHSITYPIGKAFLDYCKKSKRVSQVQSVSSKNQSKEPCLIVFDAHPDCMPPKKPHSHEDWLRALIEYGFPVKNILLVGIRNSDPQENTFLKEKRILTISMNQLLENLHETCDVIMEFSNNKELYLSIDIDVIDPAFAPSTGYKEPGGLTSREFIYLLQRINKIKKLKAVDIVEINSELDKNNNNLTVKLGAKIVSELI